MTNTIDAVIIFRILKKLVTKWEDTEAFKAGVIDKNGKVLIPVAKRTAEQKKTMTLLDRLVFNLKRLLGKVPGGKTQLASYVAALALIREHVQTVSNEETAVHLIEKLEEHKFIPPTKQYDLTTVEGFMDAWEDEMIREMSSGAGIGGAFDGAQTNAATNATGMAGPNGPSKKKKKGLDKILNRRL